MESRFRIGGGQYKDPRISETTTPNRGMELQCGQVNMKCLFLLFLLSMSATAGHAAERKVLVYTRNFTPDGKGYVHDNIQASVTAIRKMGSEAGFAVDASDDPAVFTAANLKQYQAVVFSNSNNQAFTSQAQRDAFKGYIESGGGFVGIHSASGSEREWPYFWSVVGGKFQRHPAFQKFTIHVKDPNHASTRHLPASFEWEDECYFVEYLNPDLHPLLVTDPAKLKDPDRAKYPRGLVGDSLPLAWTLRVGPGRAFYTSLGHSKESYANPILYQHILGGIQWAMEREGQ
jgi:type 1 glutamine amidotransferase